MATPPRSRTRVTTYLYPWDVDGDPAAADRVAGLGAPEVSLAVAYHAVRAVTPFHPAHRVVTRDAAVYHRPDPANWREAALRPAAPTPPRGDRVGGGDAVTAAEHGDVGSFERAAGRLREAGLRVGAWLVLAHNDRLAASRRRYAVRNAYGDRYPWALCVGQPEVARYAATLAAEVAALDCVDSIELEACGWYGFEHASTHDKTGGTAPPGTAGWLLDVCFCDVCRAAFAAAEADPDQLARAVRVALDAGYQLIGQPPAGDPPTWDGPDKRTAAPGLLPPDVTELVSAVRAAAAEGFAGQVLEAVRKAAPGKDVLVHAHPDPWRAGSNPGFQPAVLLEAVGADGIVLGCPGPARQSADLVARTLTAAPGTGAGQPLISATLNAVSGAGGQPDGLADRARAVLAAGATRLGLYHAGLASPLELAAVSRTIAAVR